MKYYIPFFAALLIGGLLFFSCNSGQEKQSPVNEQQEQQADEHHASGKEVKLNKGQKWQANDATTQGIGKMKKLIASFEAADDSAACQNLGNQLEEEFKTIFKKCTMTGEAHEQLHNYLFPMKEPINNLQKGAATDCRENLTILEQHLDKYGEYFE